jgi:hypothetical protein
MCEWYLMTRIINVCDDDDSNKTKTAESKTNYCEEILTFRFLKFKMTFFRYTYIGFTPDKHQLNL